MNKGQERALARIADYQQVFGTAAGKKVLNDLVKTYLLINPHAEKDSHGTEFNCGAQSVVQTILAKLKYDIDKITQTLKEAEEEENDDV